MSHVLPCFCLTHMEDEAFCGRFFFGPRRTCELGAEKKSATEPSSSMCVLEPYLHVKQELSVAEGLIFSERRIVLPAALQRKVVKLGHGIGHLGKTKTKQMLREKYWFPLLNSMIDTAIDQCYECQVATKRDREEPIKVTSVLNRPWDTVSIHHGGPYLDRHYNLVLIEKRTRYPVVKSVPSTEQGEIEVHLRHIWNSEEN